MKGLFQRLWKSTDGAVAPTVALSMVGLIAAGGLAFDYAHIVSLDTEMQQAADMAALAAATQLDRADDADDRAAASIQDGTTTDRLAANFTRFANDGEGAAVEIENVIFCSAFDDAVADTDAACEETTDGAEARFVIVRTFLRTANYSFTPIVAAVSGTARAEAVAGVESSICNIAPLFVCTENAAFPTEEDIGRGLLMKTGSQNSWFPGNYGYLNFGNGNTGIEAALMGHGLNGCQPIDESNTAPGNKSATDAINTRFDVYSETGQIRASACTDAADGAGCPDPNVNKDMVMKMTWVKKQNKDLPQPTPAACGTPATGNAGNPNPQITYTSWTYDNRAKGMPRDACHYGGEGACAAVTTENNNFGDGTWDAATYMAANHPNYELDDVPSEGTTPTRYEMYKWELTHKDDVTAANRTLDPVNVVPPVLIDTKAQGNDITYTFERVCAFRQPIHAPAAAGDRRILPVVAANCAGLNGASNLDEFEAIRVFNVFLTEPSWPRTDPQQDKEIYGEVIGPAEDFESGSGFQYYSRNRPYLVR